MKNCNLRNEILEEISKIKESINVVYGSPLEYTTHCQSDLKVRRDTLKWVLEKMDTPSKHNEYGQQRFAIVYVEKTQDVIDTLLKQGYDKRSGDASYTKDCIAIVLGKKWFWECNKPEKYRQMSYDYF